MNRIREIIRPMGQGATEAILCRAEDDCQYVVKTGRSGRDSLVREWLGYRIAHGLGLPIPDAEMVYMDRAAARYSVYQEAAALVECPGFGSSLIEPVDHLRVTDIDQVDAEVRRRVLLFDWWVINGDRQDANPNLLWLESGKSLYVIDHNLAFGQDLPEDFWKSHIFRRDRNGLAQLRAQMIPRMSSIIQDLPRYWDQLPAEWTESCILQPEQVDTILRRCLSDDFWSGQ